MRSSTPEIKRLERYYVYNQVIYQFHIDHLFYGPTEESVLALWKASKQLEKTHDGRQLIEFAYRQQKEGRLHICGHECSTSLNEKMPGLFTPNERRLDYNPKDLPHDIIEIQLGTGEVAERLIHELGHAKSDYRWVTFTRTIPGEQVSLLAEDKLLINTYEHELSKIKSKLNLTSEEEKLFKRVMNPEQYLKDDYPHPQVKTNVYLSEIRAHMIEVSFRNAAFIEKHFPETQRLVRQQLFLNPRNLIQLSKPIIKVVDNVDGVYSMSRFGVPDAPPLFENVKFDDLLTPPPPFKKLTVTDIRKIKGGFPEKFMYALLEDGELIISSRFSDPVPLTAKECEEIIKFARLGRLTGTMINGKLYTVALVSLPHITREILFDSDGQTPLCKRIPLVHPDITGGRRVVIAGEFHVLDGQIVPCNSDGIFGIDIKTGHYRVEGEHLGPIVENAFVRAGFTEAKGLFNDYIFTWHGQEKLKFSPRIVWPLAHYVAPNGLNISDTPVGTKFIVESRIAQAIITGPRQPASFVPSLPEVGSNIPTADLGERPVYPLVRVGMSKPTLPWVKTPGVYSNWRRMSYLSPWTIEGRQAILNMFIKNPNAVKTIGKINRLLDPNKAFTRPNLLINGSSIAQDSLRMLRYCSIAFRTVFIGVDLYVQYQLYGPDGIGIWALGVASMSNPLTAGVCLVGDFTAGPAPNVQEAEELGRRCLAYVHNNKSSALMSGRSDAKIIGFANLNVILTKLGAKAHSLFRHYGLEKYSRAALYGSIPYEFAIDNKGNHIILGSAFGKALILNSEQFSDFCEWALYNDVLVIKSHKFNDGDIDLQTIEKALNVENISETKSAQAHFISEHGKRVLFIYEGDPIKRIFLNYLGQRLDMRQHEMNPLKLIADVGEDSLQTSTDIAHFATLVESNTENQRFAAEQLLMNQIKPKNKEDGDKDSTGSKVLTYEDIKFLHENTPRDERQFREEMQAHSAQISWDNFQRHKPEIAAFYDSLGIGMFTGQQWADLAQIGADIIQVGIDKYTNPVLTPEQIEGAGTIAGAATGIYFKVNGGNQIMFTYFFGSSSASAAEGAATGALAGSVVTIGVTFVVIVALITISYLINGYMPWNAEKVKQFLESLKHKVDVLNEHTDALTKHLSDLHKCFQYSDEYSHKIIEFLDGLYNLAMDVSDDAAKIAEANNKHTPKKYTEDAKKGAAKTQKSIEKYIELAGATQTGFEEARYRFCLHLKSLTNPHINNYDFANTMIQLLGLCLRARGNNDFEAIKDYWHTWCEWIEEICEACEYKLYGSYNQLNLNIFMMESFFKLVREAYLKTEGNQQQFDDECYKIAEELMEADQVKAATFFLIYKAKEEIASTGTTNVDSYLREILETLNNENKPLVSISPDKLNGYERLLFNETLEVIEALKTDNKHHHAIKDKMSRLVNSRMRGRTFWIKKPGIGTVCQELSFEDTLDYYVLCATCLNQSEYVSAKEFSDTLVDLEKFRGQIGASASKDKETQEQRLKSVDKSEIHIRSVNNTIENHFSNKAFFISQLEDHPQEARIGLIGAYLNSYNIYGAWCELDKLEKDDKAESENNDSKKVDEAKDELDNPGGKYKSTEQTTKRVHYATVSAVHAVAHLIVCTAGSNLFGYDDGDISLSLDTLKVIGNLYVGWDESLSKSMLDERFVEHMWNGVEQILLISKRLNASFGPRYLSRTSVDVINTSLTAVGLAIKITNSSSNFAKIPDISTARWMTDSMEHNEVVKYFHRDAYQVISAVNLAGRVIDLAFDINSLRVHGRVRPSTQRYAVAIRQITKAINAIQTKLAECVLVVNGAFYVTEYYWPETIPYLTNQIFGEQFNMFVGKIVSFCLSFIKENLLSLTFGAALAGLILPVVIPAILRKLGKHYTLKPTLNFFLPLIDTRTHQNYLITDYGIAGIYGPHDMINHVKEGLNNWANYILQSQDHAAHIDDIHVITQARHEMTDDEVKKQFQEYLSKLEDYYKEFLNNKHPDTETLIDHLKVYAHFILLCKQIDYAISLKKKPLFLMANKVFMAVERMPVELNVKLDEIVAMMLVMIQQKLQHRMDKLRNQSNNPFISDGLLTQCQDKAQSHVTALENYYLAMRVKYIQCLGEKWMYLSCFTEFLNLMNSYEITLGVDANALFKTVEEVAKSNEKDYVKHMDKELQFYTVLSQYLLLDEVSALSHSFLNIVEKRLIEYLNHISVEIKAIDFAKLDNDVKRVSASITLLNVYAQYALLCSQLEHESEIDVKQIMDLSATLFTNFEKITDPLKVEISQVPALLLANAQIDVAKLKESEENSAEIKADVERIASVLETYFDGEKRVELFEGSDAKLRYIFSLIEFVVFKQASSMDIEKVHERLLNELTTYYGSGELAELENLQIEIKLLALMLRLFEKLHDKALIEPFITMTEDRINQCNVLLKKQFEDNSEKINSFSEVDTRLSLLKIYINYMMIAGQFDVDINLTKKPLFTSAKPLFSLIDRLSDSHREQCIMVAFRMQALLMKKLFHQTEKVVMKQTQNQSTDSANSDLCKKCIEHFETLNVYYQTVTLRMLKERSEKIAFLRVKMEYIQIQSSIEFKANLNPKSIDILTDLVSFYETDVLNNIIVTDVECSLFQYVFAFLSSQPVDMYEHETKLFLNLVEKYLKTILLSNKENITDINMVMGIYIAYISLCFKCGIDPSVDLTDYFTCVNKALENAVFDNNDNALCLKDFLKSLSSVFTNIVMLFENESNEQLKNHFTANAFEPLALMASQLRIFSANHSLNDISLSSLLVNYILLCDKFGKDTGLNIYDVFESAQTSLMNAVLQGKNLKQPTANILTLARLLVNATVTHYQYLPHLLITHMTDLVKLFYVLSKLAKENDNEKLREQIDSLRVNIENRVIDLLEHAEKTSSKSNELNHFTRLKYWLMFLSDDVKDDTLAQFNTCVSDIIGHVRNGLISHCRDFFLLELVTQLTLDVMRWYGKSKHLTVERCVEFVNCLSKHILSLSTRFDESNLNEHVASMMRHFNTSTCEHLIMKLESAYLAELRAMHLSAESFWLLASEPSIVLQMIDDMNSLTDYQNDTAWLAIGNSQDTTLNDPNVMLLAHFAYEHVLLFNRNNVEACLKLARIYQHGIGKLPHLQKAQSYYLRVIAEEPNNLEARNGYLDCLQPKCQDTDVWCQLGYQFFRGHHFCSEDSLLACLCWERVLSIDPTHSNALYLYALCFIYGLGVDKNLQKARECLVKLIKAHPDATKDREVYVRLVMSQQCNDESLEDEHYSKEQWILLAKQFVSDTPPDNIRDIYCAKLCLEKAGIPQDAINFENPQLEDIIYAENEANLQIALADEQVISAQPIELLLDYCDYIKKCSEQNRKVSIEIDSYFKTLARLISPSAINTGTITGQFLQRLHILFVKLSDAEPIATCSSHERKLLENVFIEAKRYYRRLPDIQQTTYDWALTKTTTEVYYNLACLIWDTRRSLNIYDLIAKSKKVLIAATVELPGSHEDLVTLTRLCDGTFQAICRQLKGNGPALSDELTRLVELIHVLTVLAHDMNKHIFHSLFTVQLSRIATMAINEIDQTLSVSRDVDRLLMEQDEHLALNRFTVQLFAKAIDFDAVLSYYRMQLKLSQSAFSFIQSGVKKYFWLTVFIRTAKNVSLNFVSEYQYHLMRILARSLSSLTEVYFSLSLSGKRKKTSFYKVKEEDTNSIVWLDYNYQQSLREMLLLELHEQYLKNTKSFKRLLEEKLVMIDYDPSRQNDDFWVRAGDNYVDHDATYPNQLSALICYQRALAFNPGNYRANYMLACMYHRGIATAANLAKAEYHYLKAIKQENTGDYLARNSYLDLLGKNYKSASEWYNCSDYFSISSYRLIQDSILQVLCLQRALKIDSTHTSSLFAYAGHLRDGYGVEKDISEAKNFLNTAMLIDSHCRFIRNRLIDIVSKELKSNMPQENISEHQHWLHLTRQFLSQNASGGVSDRLCATICFENALQNDPAKPDVQSFLNRVQQATSDTDILTIINHYENPETNISKAPNSGKTIKNNKCHIPPVNTKYQATDADIHTYLNAYLGADFNNLFHIQYSDKAEHAEHGYLVAVCKSTGIFVDEETQQRYEMPIGFYLNKANQPTPVRQDDRVDVFDSLLPILCDEQNPEQHCKILFPYNETGNHWTTCEIQIHRSGSTYQIETYLHDPYGGGMLDDDIHHKIIDDISQRILSVKQGSQFTPSINHDSPYQRRLSDAVSCGFIQARDLIRRVLDLPLDPKNGKPFPPGAKVLRELQLKRVMQVLANENNHDDQDCELKAAKGAQYIKRVTLSTMKQNIRHFKKGTTSTRFNHFGQPPSHDGSEVETCNYTTNCEGNNLLFSSAASPAFSQTAQS